MRPANFVVKRFALVRLHHSPSLTQIRWVFFVNAGIVKCSHDNAEANEHKTVKLFLALFRAFFVRFPCDLGATVYAKPTLSDRLQSVSQEAHNNTPPIILPQEASQPWRVFL